MASQTAFADLEVFAVVNEGVVILAEVNSTKTKKVNDGNSKCFHAGIKWRSTHFSENPKGLCSRA